jgi:Ankyrin repeats (3 copies)
MHWAVKLNDAVAHGAAASASLPKLGWLHTTMGCELPNDIYNYAARSGSAEVLRWLLQRGYRLDSKAYTHAAECGQWDMLKVLRAEGLEWGVLQGHPSYGHAPCSIAIQQGNLEAVRWLYKNGCPESSVDLGELATAAGSVEALRYAKEQLLGLCVHWESHQVRCRERPCACTRVPAC